MGQTLLKAVIIAAVFFGVWVGLEFVFSAFITHQSFAPNWGFATAAGLIFGGIVLLKARRP